MTAAVCRQADFASALLDPGLPCPSGLIAWNGSDPAARLAVYRNNVVSSLIDALADTFPVVQELVGVEFFRAMASVFVRQAPPSSRLLAFFGEAFPAFIERFEPAQSVPYLADVARLEMARVRAYHAADGNALSDEAVQIALSSGERSAQLRLGCHPSVRVIVSLHAIVSLWAAHQGEGDLGTVDPGIAESALVLRQGLDVIVLRLSRGNAAFMTAILHGRALGDAASIALDTESNFDLSAALSLALARGAISSIHVPGDFESPD